MRWAPLFQLITRPPVSSPTIAKSITSSTKVSMVVMEEMRCGAVLTPRPEVPASAGSYSSTVAALLRGALPRPGEVSVAPPRRGRTL
jgi:hypothetical protein